MSIPTKIETLPHKSISIPFVEMFPDRRRNFEEIKDHWFAVWATWEDLDSKTQSFVLRQWHRYIPQSQGYHAQSWTETQRLLHRTKIYWYFFIQTRCKNRIQLVSRVIYIFRTSLADQRDQIWHTTMVLSNMYLPSHNMAVQVNRITIKLSCIILKNVLLYRPYQL